MEAMDASGSRLCQIIQGAGLRPRTAQRFQTVLATAGIVALADAGFASRMDDMMVNSIRKFTAVKKRADDLAVLLQPARPGSSLPATLIGLHGDELFQALVALQVPEVATKNVHLEAALTTAPHHARNRRPAHPRLRGNRLHRPLQGKRGQKDVGLLPAAGIFGRHCSEARRPGHESRCYLGAVRWAGALSRGGGRRRWMHLFFLPPVTSTASPRGLNVLLV